MRIGLDATFLFDQYANRGIGTYGRELYNHLLEKDDCDWVLFGFEDLQTNLSKLKVRKAKNIKFVKLGRTRKSNPFNLFYFKFFYKRKIKQAKLDLYFAPNFERGLPIGLVKTAVMMHDCIPYITESYSQKGKLINFLKGLFYKYNLRKAKKADLILTNSDFSKRELVNKAGFPENKIIKTYLGINKRFHQDNIATGTRDLRRVLVMYKIAKPYLLYYGGLEENKNIETLLISFSKITSRFPDLKLVIAGKEFKVGWDNKPQPLTASAIKVLNLIEELKLKHKVIISGEIDNNHIPLVLNNATAFVHLSTYEGFGFAALEALAAGVPLVAARRSSYPEVLKKAAHFVNPEDKDKVAEALQEIIQDKQLRQQLIQKGLEVSKQYAWEKTAKATFELLKQEAEAITPLKIGYITPYFHPVKGGAENNALHLALQMVKLGHQVTVFTSNTSEGLYPNEEEYEGIRIRRFNRLNDQYYLGVYPSMFFALLSSNQDIIHAHGFGFIWHDFCLLFKKLFSRKTQFINTPHGPFMAHGDYSLPQKLMKSVYTFVQKLLLNRIYSKIIQVNPNQEQWITNYGIAQEKITYIPNGIPEELFQEVETSKLEKEYNLNRKFIISFIGRFEKYKGLQDIISALPRLTKERSNLHLIALGNKGNYLTKLRKQIKEEGLEKRITLLVSPTDEVRDQALQLSDIFILPSAWEAFGISILEAMAKNNAIISSRTEGGKFLITEEENGYLYDYGDVQELGNRIEKLMTDKKLLSKIQENNLEKAKEFIWDKIGKQYYLELKELSK